MNGDGFGTSGVRSRCSDWDGSSAPTLVGPYRGCQWGEQSRPQGLYIGTREAPQAPCFVGSIPRLHTGYKIGTAELTLSGYRSRCFASPPPHHRATLWFLGVFKHIYAGSPAGPPEATSRVVSSNGTVTAPTSGARQSPQSSCTFMRSIHFALGVSWGLCEAGAPGAPKAGLVRFITSPTHG